MKFLGNVIWLLFGGIIIALEYFIFSLLLMVTIIGIPFGLQTMKMVRLALWPFGYEARSNGFYNGCLGVIMNVFWILLGGIEIFITHVIFGLILSITIIGIPLGRQHFKLAALSFTPFGMNIKAKK